MLDRDGFRPNVGIVLANGQGQVLWARRVGGHDAWQFPQGGVNEGETLTQALHRELEEETGLTATKVKILAQTNSWLRYRIPRKFRRYNSDPDFRGQKQHWFLLQLDAAEDAIALDSGEKPEFDGWRWVSYWYPVGQVVEFKRNVYQRALLELAPHLPLPDSARAPGRVFRPVTGSATKKHPSERSGADSRRRKGGRGRRPRAAKGFRS